MINVNVSVKKCHTCKKDPSTCICENSSYLKSIVDDSVIVCDEIISVINGVVTSMRRPTNATSTVQTNVTSTVSTNSDDEKVIYKMDS